MKTLALAADFHFTLFSSNNNSWPSHKHVFHLSYQELLAKRHLIKCTFTFSHAAKILVQRIYQKRQSSCPKRVFGASRSALNILNYLVHLIFFPVSLFSQFWEKNHKLSENWQQQNSVAKRVGSAWTGIIYFATLLTTLKNAELWTRACKRHRLSSSAERGHKE